MTCIRIQARASRLKKKYSLARNLPRYGEYIASGEAGVENLLVQISDSDSVSVTFAEPFAKVPSIVASFISPDPLGLVNVFIETASETGATIRTSATTTGFISIHAMYIEGAPVPDYTFAPVVTLSAVMGAAVVGSAPVVAPPTVISNPTETTLYTLYVNGSAVPGYTLVTLSTLSSYTYQAGDIGTLTYVDVTVNNSKGTVIDASNTVTIA